MNVIHPDIWLLLQALGIVLLLAAIARSVVSRPFGQLNLAAAIGGLLLMFVPEITAPLFVLGLLTLAVRRRRRVPAS